MNLTDDDCGSAASFDPNATRCLCTAFDAALSQLDRDAEQAQDIATRTLLAKLIIELFKAGERDCDRLAQRASALVAPARALSTMREAAKQRRHPPVTPRPRTSRASWDYQLLSNQPPPRARS